MDLARPTLNETYVWIDKYGAKRYENGSILVYSFLECNFLKLLKSDI